MRPFRTDKGAHVHVFPITITMNTSATFRCVIYAGQSTYDKIFNLEGTEYTNWGANDDYIKEYICDKEGFIGRPVPEEDVDGNPIVYQAPEPVQDDNRSMHNEADIRKINDLETELNEQKLKLDKILGLLGKNNLI